MDRRRAGAPLRRCRVLLLVDGLCRDDADDQRRHGLLRQALWGHQLPRGRDGGARGAAGRGDRGEGRGDRVRLPSDGHRDDKFFFFELFSLFFFFFFSAASGRRAHRRRQDPARQGRRQQRDALGHFRAPAARGTSAQGGGRIPREVQEIAVVSVDPHAGRRRARSPPRPWPR